MQLKIVLSVLVLFSLIFFVPSDASASEVDITAVRAQSLGNNFEYDDLGLYNSLVQVDSDTFALAYTGTDNDGFISTFNISSDGTTITEVETIEHDDDFAWDNSLIKVDSDTFALAYGGSDEGWSRPAGFISTFTIDSDGTITPIRIQNHAAFASASENLNHDTNEGSVNSLVHVNDDTYALSYERNGVQLGITTFTISSDGATITELDTLNSDVDNCNDRQLQSLVKVDSDTVARAYCGSGGDGFLRTFSIAENGDITKKSTYEFDTSQGTEHFLVQVDSDTVALAYENSEISVGRVTETNGVIKTFTINSSDEISEADSLEHHSGNTPSTGNAEDNFLVRVDSDIFALAYDDGSGGNDGFISTFTIDSDGNITGLSTANQGNNLEHDTSFSSNRSLVKVDSNTVALAYQGVGGAGFISTFTISVTNTVEEKVKKSSDCYDCEAPKLTKVEVHVSSSPFDYVWNFDQKSPYPMFGDDITPIVADPGDDVEIILELTDNRTLKRVYDSGAYTNFLTKPNDMNLFYANNFDEFGKVSTTFYEWHQTGDDLVYDYDDTVEWSEADVTIEESGEFVKDGTAENLDALVGTFTISFNMKFLEPMQTSEVWVQATDRSGNFFKVALPLTLKVSGNEPLVFESKVNQKVLSFYDESMLYEVVSDWNGSSQDVSELTTILGIPDEHLLPWVANLAVWVSEDRITVADMIVAIEYLINQ